MKILFLLLVIPCQLLAQDYSGIWTGFLTVNNTRVPYELVISNHGKDNISGYSLTVFIIDNIENTGIKSVNIKNKKNGISIEDDKLVFDDYKMPSKRVTLYGKLSFEPGSASVLQGSFFTRSADRSSFNGSIYLEKKDNLSKTKLVTHLEKLDLLNKLSFLKPVNPIEEQKPVAGSGITNAPGVANPNGQTGETATALSLKEGQVPVSLPVKNKLHASANVSALPTKSTPAVVKVAADYASRKTEITRSIFVQSDSLVLSLYDNGEVDGDTVSVLVNANVVIARKGLSTTPLKTTVKFQERSIDSIMVIMYAENLGRIAPNTGLLIIEDGNEKYQVRFEGDLQKNSAVVLRRKK